LKLQILLDQNIPPAISGFLCLQRPEWTVWHVSQLGMSGAPDEQIFAWAQRNQAIVITFDEDFADARMYPVGEHAGVIRLRVWPTTVEETERALGRLLLQVNDDDLRGSLIIVDRHGIRVRRSARHG
jgi:predicted nuclease of predicted toxin-antitoxin system